MIGLSQFKLGVFFQPNYTYWYRILAVNSPSKQVGNLVRGLIVCFFVLTTPGMPAMALLPQGRLSQGATQVRGADYVLIYNTANPFS